MTYQPPHSFLMWQEKNKNLKLKIEVKKNMKKANEVWYHTTRHTAHEYGRKKRKN